MRVLAIFAASYSVAVYLSVYGKLDSRLLPIGMFLAAVTLAVLLLKKQLGRKGTVVVLCTAGMAAGFLWSFGYQQIFIEPARALNEQTVRLSAQVVQWPEESEQGYSVLVRAELPGGGTADTLLYTDEQGAQLRPGDRIQSVVRCRFADRTFSGEEITYYTAKGVFLRGVAYGTLYVERPERLPISAFPAVLSRMLEESITGAFPESTGAQVLAIVTGNRNNLSQPFTTSLQRTGLSHTAAVSGMHLAFLSGALAFLLGRHRRRTSLIVIPVTLLFMVVAGCTPSVVRATVMVGMLLAAPLFERERDDVTSLCAALLVLLLQNPLAAAHVGLQLSFAAVAGIFLVSEPIQNWLDRALHIQHHRRWSLKWAVWLVPNYFVSTLSATLGALVLTTPLCAIHFSSVSLLSPLSNFMTLWAVAVIFGGGLLVGLAGIFSPVLASLFAAVVTPFAQYMDWAVAWLGRMPFAAITMDSFYYKLWTILLSFAILSMLVKRSKGVVAAFGAMCAVTLPVAMLFTGLEFYSGPMSVTALDVGQGQSVLLRQGKHLTLVDCGGDTYDNAGDLAANHMQNVGRGTLDLLVLTHFHEDHANGVPQLLERLRVKQIVMPDVEEDSPLRQEILALAEEKEIECLVVREDTVLPLGEESSLTLYAPLGAEDTNELGLTVIASTQKLDVLITGDMGLEVEQLLLEHADLPDVEVMLAGHHGSKYATSQELLEAVDPELVLISVSKDNVYGHPAPETLERLEHREVHRTDLEGTVTVRLSRP